MAFTVQQFFQRFPDDNSCLLQLMIGRYGESLDCPKCKKHGRFTKLSNMPAFACAWCGHHIHPMAGTPFQSSHTPLQKWFYAMYLFTTSSHGVSAKELQRQLGVTYKTAWRMGHEIRKYMDKIDGDKPLKVPIEFDETMIGGKRSVGKRGRGAPGKTTVMGMLERNGFVMTKVVPNLRRKMLEPHIVANIAPLSTISTDELPSYNKLSKYGNTHGSVNHREEKWENSIQHTNSIKGFWSQLKQSICGTHIYVSGKPLSKYLVEFEYRFNLRLNPEKMFPRLFAGFSPSR